MVKFSLDEGAGTPERDGPVKVQGTPRRPAAAPQTPSRLGLDDYGDSYMTFNPGMLDDKAHFSMNSLQKICKNIGVNNEGSREQLVKRLRSWHNIRLDGKKGQKGANFHFMRVKESALPQDFKSPFKKHNACDTPKSILRTKSRFPTPPPKATVAETPKSVRQMRTPHSRKSHFSTPDSETFHSPLSASAMDASQEASPNMLSPMGGMKLPQPSTPKAATPTSKKRSKLCFSPYNQVRLMPPRSPTPASPSCSKSRSRGRSESEDEGSVDKENVQTSNSDQEPPQLKKKRKSGSDSESPESGARKKKTKVSA
jgi:hypothetical protein